MAGQTQTKRSELAELIVIGLVMVYKIWTVLVCLEIVFKKMRKMSKGKGEMAAGIGCDHALLTVVVEYEYSLNHPVGLYVPVSSTSPFKDENSTVRIKGGCLAL